MKGPDEANTRSRCVDTEHRRRVVHWAQAQRFSPFLGAEHQGLPSVNPKNGGKQTTRSSLLSPGRPGPVGESGDGPALFRFPRGPPQLRAASLEGARCSHVNRSQSHCRSAGVGSCPAAFAWRFGQIPAGLSSGVPPKPGC